MTPIRVDLPEWFLIPWLFALGAIIGSFLNVCIYRIPTQERLWDQLRSLWNRPSQCPYCRKNIPWYENVPILGWLKIRGRCSNCKRSISPRYPLIEFLNGALWVLVYYLEVPLGYGKTLGDSVTFTLLGPEIVPGLNAFNTWGGISPELFLHLRFVYHMVLIEALLVATFIDFDLRIIPDGSTVPAMIVGVLASFALGCVHLLPVWFQSPGLWNTFRLFLPEWTGPLLNWPAVPTWIATHPHLHGLAVSITGLLVGGGLVWMVRILGGWLLRQEAMGFGDVILMAMIGSFLGWQATIIAFFLGAVCGSIVSLIGWTWAYFAKRELDRYIPFGPYLSLGALLTIIAWKHVFRPFEFYFELGLLIVPMSLVVVVLFALSLMLVQGVKLLAGMPLGPEQPPGEWTAADQTSFFAGEHVERHTCRWRTQDWEGNAAGRGQSHQEQWRWGASGRSPFSPGGMLGGHWRR